MRIISFALRIFIGGILLASAIGKALDLNGFVEVLKTYQAFPSLSLIPLAVLVTLSEIMLGGSILLGWYLRTAALLAALMNGAYALWMILTLFRGLELNNCGCFGVFFPRPLTWVSPLEDFFMVFLCLLLRVFLPKSGH